MTHEDLVADHAAVKHRAESNTRRIEKLELQTEALTDLATSVKLVAQEIGHQTETINRIEENVTTLTEKVDELEKKPAKKWDTFVDKVVWAICAAIISFALTAMGLVK